MARRASVTKPLSVIMAPRRSSRKVRAERFGTAWARRVSQAQRGIGIGVSMGRHRRRSKTLQLRALPTRCARFAGSAVTLKGQQATKNLTPEGADQATETLNSSSLPHGPVCSSTLNGIDGIIHEDVWEGYIARNGNEILPVRKFS